MKDDTPFMSSGLGLDQQLSVITEALICLGCGGRKLIYTFNWFYVNAFCIRRNCFLFVQFFLSISIYEKRIPNTRKILNFSTDTGHRWPINLQKMALNTAHANGGVLIHAGERWNNSQTQKVFSKLMFNALQHSSFLRQCHHGVCRPGTDCEHGHNACFWVLFYFVDCFYH